MNYFKFQKTLQIIFYNKIGDKRNYLTACFNSKTSIVTSGLDIGDGFWNYSSKYFVKSLKIV